MAPTIQTSIHKIDFDGVSIAFDVDDIAYLMLAEQADEAYPLKFDIHLLSNVAEPIRLTATEAGREALQAEYRNLYTKWRNADKAYKSASSLTYTYGNYDV